ncbi:MAG: hypothetical protein MZV64_68040 [Ignavibacteriales bacterium]|nr:hypothetical protein [Ignavibacteriales bacterium]
MVPNRLKIDLDAGRDKLLARRSRSTAPSAASGCTAPPAARPEVRRQGAPRRRGPPASTR